MDEFKDYRVGENSKVYTVDGTKITGPALDSVREYLDLSGINRIKPLNRKAYQNEMI